MATSEVPATITRRAAAAALLLALAGCTETVPARAGPGGPVDFAIGGMAFHAASGAAVPSSGGLTLYLSDQPDACLALTFVPVGTATTFRLRVVPQPDGTTRATVVAAGAVPAAGQAVGRLWRATGGVENAALDAADGAVAWTVEGGGSVAIDALDVGFAGTADRLTTWGLTLRPCP